MRKFLSMVLSLAMVLSLMTAFAGTASAKNFTNFEDDDQVSNVYYEEAVDVITAVGIMNGRSDTTFAPQDTLTRGAASKIICNMLLGPNAADALPSSANPFKDVAAGSTFAGYIAYVASKGIVNGYSDGTFRPAEALSGYAFLKMLLGALGYSNEIEGYTGDNWKVNVAKQAMGTTSHITKNLINEDQFNGNAAITREEAALFAFNTLCNDMVEYGLRVGNGSTILGSDIARSRVWSGSAGEYNNIIPQNSNGYRDGDGQGTSATGGIVQFAEENFPRLVRRNTAYQGYSDGFGRPSTVWTYKGVEIGTYTEIPTIGNDSVAAYTGNMAVNTIYKDLGMVDSDPDAELYINGVSMGRINVARSNDDDLNGTTYHNLNDGVLNKRNVPNAPSTAAVTYEDYADQKIGDGTLTEVFLDTDYNHVTICSRSVYPGKVTSVKAPTSTKDDYVIIDHHTGSPAWKHPFTINNANKNEFETTEFEEDDVVWFTYSEKDSEIKEMHLMDPVEGSLDRRYVEKRMVLNGVNYNYGKMYTFDDMTENDLTNNSAYIVYLDDSGYALWIEESEVNIDDYALITSITYLDETTTGNSTTYTTWKLLDKDHMTWNDNDSMVDVGGVLVSVTKYVKDANGDNVLDAAGNPVPNTSGYDYTDPDTGRTVRVPAVPASTTWENYRASYYELDTAEGSAYNRNRARVLWANGTESTINLDDIYDEWYYRPGMIVRATRTSSGSSEYKLQSQYKEWGFTNDLSTYKNSMSGMYVFDYRSSGDEYEPYGTSGTRNMRGDDVAADAHTRFVYRDVTDRYKVKKVDGIQKIDDVTAGMAFAYEKNGMAQVVFIYDEGNVKASNRDVIFIAANSASKLITADSTKVDYYRTYTAIVNGEVEEIRVSRDAVLDRVGGGIADFRGLNGYDKAYLGTFVNDVTREDGIITAGTWTRDYANDPVVRYAYGIRKYDDGEIKVNTNDIMNGSTVLTVAKDIEVFYVDGDDIDEIDVTDYSTDSDDIIFYQLEDGEVTMLVIVAYDSSKDGDPEDPYKPDSFNVAGYQSNYWRSSVSPKSVDLSGATLTVGYTDGTSQTFTNASGVTSGTFETTSAGPQTVALRYRDMSRNVTVNVWTPVLSLANASVTCNVGETIAVPTTLTRTAAESTTNYSDTVSVTNWYQQSNGAPSVQIGGPYTAAGTYVYQASYTNDGAIYEANAAIPTLTVTVNPVAPPPQPTVTYAVSPATITVTLTDVNNNGTNVTDAAVQTNWQNWFATKSVKLVPTDATANSIDVSWTDLTLNATEFAAALAGASTTATATVTNNTVTWTNDTANVITFTFDRTA